MRALLTCFLVSTLFISAAQAQDMNTLLDVPQGSTIVNLSATERVEVEQDLLIASLSYQAENKDPKIVQNEINEIMKKALEAAKKVPSVKATTQQYYVYEYDISNGAQGSRRNMAWRGQQGLEIKGKAADDLLKLAGDLQAIGLAMNGLTYTVSPELLEDTRNSLLEAALVKLKDKAERTAKALGKTSTEFLQINIDIGGYYPQPVMRAMAMDAGMAKAEMAAPVAAPGESEITLTVNANTLLSK